MEQAAFESFDPGLLKELGRLVVNCGFAEFLLDLHVSSLFAMSDVHARRALISPLATRRKIDILQEGLKSIPRADTRALVEEACTLFGDSLTARNEMLHGIWGFDGPSIDAQPVCITTKRASGHRTTADISAVADAVALASRKFADAFLVDQGKAPSSGPERLVLDLAK